MDLVGQLVRVVDAIEGAARERQPRPTFSRSGETAPWCARDMDEEARVVRAWKLFLEAAGNWDADLKGRRAQLDSGGCARRQTSCESGWMRRRVISGS